MSDALYVLVSSHDFFKLLTSCVEEEEDRFCAWLVIDPK